MYLFLICIFVLGLIVGSFVNVIGMRYNSGMSFVSGRSKCFHCNSTLSWYELIPVFSFIFLRGKCKTCGSPISIQYPFMEVLTGLIFTLIALRQINLWPMYEGIQHGLLLSTLFGVYYAIVFGILLVIAIYDISHKIIPDKLVYSFIVLSILRFAAFAYCKHFNLTTLDLVDLSTPFILFVVFASLWFFSSGRWMGFGDAKLVFGIGFFSGFVLGVGTVVLAFWIGALFGVFTLIKAKFSNDSDTTLHTEIPFAPFLILAMILVFFTGIDVMGLDGFLSLI